MKNPPSPPKSALETKKIVLFNVLLNELYRYNMHEVKAVILEGYGVDSTKKLTPEQLEECILGLQKEKAKRNKEYDKPTRIACSKCLGLMTDIGVKTSDWAKVNAFCEQPRMLNGKRLYDLTLEELEAFAKKLHAVKSAYKQREQDEKFYAVNN
jgi:hypothetical protein